MNIIFLPDLACAEIKAINILCRSQNNGCATKPMKQMDIASC
ncbi:hypothetical protein UKKV901664_12940 [Klebsiella pneumoniae subsp. pneumoniae UKKV901664]|nr:hypothetical protein UKKV901664_12940 [Klebsiella pneumoniae subsp. pneumoniae UKKV901664]